MSDTTEFDPPEGDDNCEECLGRNGGVPGNDNIYQGKVLCDYCLAHYLREEKNDPEENKAGNA